MLKTPKMGLQGDISAGHLHPNERFIQEINALVSTITKLK